MDRYKIAVKFLPYWTNPEVGFVKLTKPFPMLNFRPIFLIGISIIRDLGIMLELPSVRGGA